MDISLQEILYFAFVIVSILFGMFGKKKKKQPQGTSESPAQPDLDLLAELFREQMPKEDVPKATAFPKTSEEPVSIPPENDILVQEREKKATSTPHKSKSTGPIYENDLTQSEQSEAFEFDVRKAIVYSEILKRPEF